MHYFRRIKAVTCYLLILRCDSRQPDSSRWPMSWITVSILTIVHWTSCSCPVSQDVLGQKCDKKFYSNSVATLVTFCRTYEGPLLIITTNTGQHSLLKCTAVTLNFLTALKGNSVIHSKGVIVKRLKEKGWLALAKQTAGCCCVFRICSSLNVNFSENKLEDLNHQMGTGDWVVELRNKICKKWCILFRFRLGNAGF